MSWGGSTLAMVVSLKNNQRKKREMFKAYGKHNSFGKQRIRYKKASEEELLRIRQIIRRENKAFIIKQLVIIAVVVGLAVYGILYLIRHYQIF